MGFFFDVALHAFSKGYGGEYRQYLEGNKKCWCLFKLSTFSSKFNFLNRFLYYIIYIYLYFINAFSVRSRCLWLWKGHRVTDRGTWRQCQQSLGQAGVTPPTGRLPLHHRATCRDTQPFTLSFTPAVSLQWTINLVQHVLQHWDWVCDPLHQFSKNTDVI